MNPQYWVCSVSKDVSRHQEKQPVQQPLSRKIELALNVAKETSLVCIKRALCAYHVEEPDYQKESRGGIVAEAVKHLVEDFSRECGTPDHFRLFFSEELGFMSSCETLGAIVNRWKALSQTRNTLVSKCLAECKIKLCFRTRSLIQGG